MGSVMGSGPSEEWWDSGEIACSLCSKDGYVQRAAKLPCKQGARVP